MAGLIGRGRVGFQIPDGILESVQHVLENHRFGEGVFAVSKVGVEDTSFTCRSEPTDRDLAGPIVDELTDGLLVHVEAHEDSKVFGPYIGLWIVLVDFVGVPEAFTVEGLIEHVLWVIELECPSSTGVPGVPGEFPTYHGAAIGVSAKVIAGRMKTCEPLSVHDEIEKSILLGGGLKLHVGGVVQKYQVVFGQILRSKHIVGIGKIDAECLGLLGHGLYGVVRVRNRAMDESFASIEQQDASFFFGSRYGLGRDCGLYGRFLRIG